MMILCLMVSGCCCQRHITPTTINNTTNEVKNTTSNHTEKEELRDSIVYVYVERERERNTTRDTTSMLETKNARSEASVSDGVLSHTLENKNDSIPIRIMWKEKEVRDTVYVEVFRDKEVEVPVEIIVEKPIRDNIFWWSIIGNVIVILLVMFKIVWKFKKIV